jgi:Tol biopolymer transport system component
MNETRIERLTLNVIGLWSLTFSGAVIVSLIYLLMVLGSLVTIRPAFAQSTAGVRLEAGVEKEEVDGDLKSAMEIYQKIANDSSTPRDVRSKALLRLAGCYEKLGRQARQVYEQIVREFADQPAAAQARSRLAALKQQEHPAPPATMTQRKIEWTAVGRMGATDTDGQRAVYQDTAGNLFFGDLAGHTKRMIFKSKPDDAPPWWDPSRDFSMVWLLLQGKPDRPGTLAVMKADGTGYRELLRDDAQGTLFGAESSFQGGPANWSWDDRYLVGVSNHQKSGSLWIVSVADGKRREVAKLETGSSVHAAFSPDGRFVAYDTAPPILEGGKQRIFVLSTQGGEPHLVYDSQSLLNNSALLDWTADGRYLTIADTSSGRMGLYLLPVKDGEAAGKPMLVRYGDFERGCTTLAGTLVYHSMKPGGQNNVYLTSLDVDSHPGGWQRMDLRGGSSFVPFPSFSPDAKQIAYVAKDPEQAGGEILVLRDLLSGEERVLYRSNGTPLICQFGAQHPKLFCTELSEEGKTDLFALATESGEVERLGSLSGTVFMFGPSHSDLALYLVKRASPQSLLRWEVASHEESVVAQTDLSAAIILPSPDERWLIRHSYHSLDIRPMSGGDWKPLVSANTNTQHVDAPRPTGFTADGNWLLYYDTDAAGKKSLFRVPLAGGHPERLGEFPGGGDNGFMRLSPDGRQLMAEIWNPNQYDLWVLENFVPSVKH